MRCWNAYPISGLLKLSTSVPCGAETRDPALIYWDLLPVKGRCLTRILPVNDGVADEEAIESGDTQRVDRSSEEALLGVLNLRPACNREFTANGLVIERGLCFVGNNCWNSVLRVFFPFYFWTRHALSYVRQLYSGEGIFLF